MCSPVLANLVKRFQKHVLCENLLKGEVGCCCLVSHYPHFCWFHDGIAEASSRVIEMSEERVIEADIRRKELLRVNGEEMKAIQHNVVLDLNDDGERWEGDVLDNQPYGWGVLYDSENRMVYEGFRIGEVNVCYGRSYYADIGVVEYEGEICEGKRWGRGALFDRNGNTVFEGEWMNHEREMEKRIEIQKEVDDHVLFHTLLEEVIVSDRCCDGIEWKVLRLSFLFNLRELRVGDECFWYVEEVEAVGLKKLERVVIGKNCFRKRRITWNRNERLFFWLKNCPVVKELRIGRGSFQYYTVCEIENDDCLEVAEIGSVRESSCNFSCASLELKSVFAWRAS
ncbi:hypothetical protein WA577_007215 [Blastocystis sp. JDR]